MSAVSRTGDVLTLVPSKVGVGVTAQAAHSHSEARPGALRCSGTLGTLGFGQEKATIG
jgi:hypothetical protein